MAPKRAVRRRGRGGLLVGSLLLVALGLGSCGGGQTRSHPLERGWDDDSGAELAALVARWQPKRAPDPPDLVVGVVDRETLVGRELPAGAGWRVSYPIGGQPTLAGEVVLLPGGGKLRALDGRSGELLWERPAVGALRGAGDDGELTVVSLESLSGHRSTVLAVDRAGVVVRQLDVSARVGAPAVADGVGFLPWNDRLVVVFDLRAGSELGRIPCANRVSHAFATDGEIFFGESTLLHFDRGIVAARFGASPALRLPPVAMPATPAWLRPLVRSGVAFEPLGPAEIVARPMVVARATSARAGPPGAGTVRESGSSDDDERAGEEAPTRSDRLGFSDGVVLARWRRALVGLDAASGAARWVRVAELEPLGAAAARDGFCLCDAAGRIECLRSQTGERAWHVELEQPLVGCELQVEQVERAAGGGRVAGGTAPAELIAELGRALRVRDQTLLALQVLLVAEIDRSPSDQASAELVALASAELVAREIRDEARARLALRRTGLDGMRAALEAEARRPPLRSFVAPVAELARALGNAQHAAAAPSLARLARRAPRGTAAVAIAEALERLASRAELGALGWLAARYACGPAGSDRSRVVRAAARAADRLSDARWVGALAALACLDDELRRELQRPGGPPPAR